MAEKLKFSNQRNKTCDKLNTAQLTPLSKQSGKSKPTFYWFIYSFYFFYVVSAFMHRGWPAASVPTITPLFSLSVFAAPNPTELLPPPHLPNRQRTGKEAVLGYGPGPGPAWGSGCQRGGGGLDLRRLLRLQPGGGELQGGGPADLGSRQPATGERDYRCWC